MLKRERPIPIPTKCGFCVPTDHQLPGFGLWDISLSREMRYRLLFHEDFTFRYRYVDRGSDVT